MANLTPQQIAAYAYKAGFRGHDLIYAVAVALRESGGNVQAYNPETAAGTAQGSGSRGLWQIYGGAHPEYNNDAVYDPAKNAAAAYAVYHAAGNKFTPWSTWNNGSAASLAMTLGNISEKTSAAASGAISSAGGIAGTVASGGAEVITGAANSIIDSLGSKLLGTNAEGKPRTKADAFAYMGGFVLIILGLIFLFVKSGAGETTVNLVGKAAKAAL